MWTSFLLRSFVCSVRTLAGRIVSIFIRDVSSVFFLHCSRFYIACDCVRMCNNSIIVIIIVCCKCAYALFCDTVRLCFAPF